MLIPFPPVTKPYSEEERFENQQKLEKAMKYTSRSVGRMIVAGMTLTKETGKALYKDVVLPFARSCLEGAKRRVLRNYAILLYFAIQVNIFL